MSFLKNLTKEFKELKASLSGDGDKEKEEKEEKHESTTEGQRAFDPGYGAPNPNYAQPAPAPYNQYPPQPLSPPQGPPLPPGWVAQFDQASGRWYYIEQATGISRWEPPASPAPYGQYDHSQVPQYAGAYGSQGAYPGQPAPYPGQQPYPGQAPYPGQGGYYDPSMGAPPGGDYSHSKGEKSDKDDKSKMLLGAAGGLAVGAVGGALVANALADDSDNETHAAAAAPPPASAPPPAGLPPDETADGDSVSSSDREDVLEARQEYEQAQLAAQDSDASSSEEEALEEAREEYEETYEEVYDD